MRPTTVLKYRTVVVVVAVLGFGCESPRFGELRGEWRELPDSVLAPRSRPTVALGPTGFVVFGGLGTACAAGVEVVCGDGASFDSLEARWDALSPTGAPSARVRAHGALVDDQLVVVGGLCGRELVPCDDGRRLTIGEAEWSGVAPAPAGLLDGEEEVVTSEAGLIHVFGTRGASYDVRGDRWTEWETAGAPTSRSRHAFTVVGARVFVWGGSDGERFLSDGAVYDLERDTWNTIAEPLEFSARADAAAVAIGSRVIIVGGACPNGPCSDAAEYDLAGNAWRSLEAFDGAVSAVAPARLVSASGRVFAWPVWGGALGELDLDADRLEISAPGPDERTGALVALFESDLVVWGGNVVEGGEAREPTSGGFTFRLLD